MKVYKLLLLILIIPINPLTGQDIHFSNYYASPLSLNPANTGNYAGNWRVMCNYRQQGDNLVNSFSTATLAYDRPIYVLSEKLSAGFVYIYDNSANNTLLVNKIYLSSAYYQRISTNSYLHLGLQVGFVHKLLNLNNLTFPDQFDISTGYFNTSMATSDYFEKQSLSYIDLNWGLIWSRKTNRLNTELGIAMFHYNSPKETFLNNSEKLAPRYQLHGIAKKRIKTSYYVKPQILFSMHDNTNEFLIGTDIGIMPVNPEIVNDFHVGIHYRGGYDRNSDALIFKVGLHYKDFDIAVAYDLGITDQKLSKYTSNAIELSIIFTRPETKIRERSVPCDIF